MNGKEADMTTLSSFAKTNILRSAFGLFAMAFALLLPLQAHAQNGETRSLINLYTGAALSNNGMNLEGAQLLTSPWIPAWNYTPQNWQIFDEPALPSGTAKKIISTNSFKVVDVMGHVALPLFAVVQAQQVLQDNSTPWRFQRWNVTRVLLAW